MRIYSSEEIPQQSEAWFALRKLKLTASEATAIGNNGKGLESLVARLVAEAKSSGERQFFSNFHTDRGNELEPIARELYEMETGQKIETVGFIEHSEYAGCSPDGLIGEEGGVEVKAPDDVKFFRLIINSESEIDTDYLWQVQMNLLITERKFWDLVFYNPNFQKSLIIFRLYPDLEKHEKLRQGLSKGALLIQEHLKKYEDQLSRSGPILIGREPEPETVVVYEGSKKPRTIKLTTIARDKRKK